MREFLQPKFIFCCFFVILARLIRSPFNRSNLPGENLSNQTLNLQMKFASLNIAITVRYQSQLFFLHKVPEFRTHIFSSKIVYYKLPELSSTQVRRRTLLRLVRHMSGVAFGPGLSQGPHHTQFNLQTTILTCHIIKQYLLQGRTNMGSTTIKTYIKQ